MPHPSKHPHRRPPLQAGSYALNAAKGKKERIGRLMQVGGQRAGCLVLWGSLGVVGGVPCCHYHVPACLPAWRLPARLRPACLRCNPRLPTPNPLCSSQMHANSREDVKEARAGDIIAIAGLKVR